MGQYDPHELWKYTVGGLFEGFTDCEVNGFVVWSDPWHWAGWELSTNLVKKWRWMLEGCHDLITTTNRWRQMRDEEIIILED